MKLSATFIPGMMLLFMSVACSVQEEDKSKDQQLAQNELCFTAEFGEIDTKTAFQADETSIWWSPADEICIYYGASGSSKFTSTNTVEVSKAQFRGNLSAFTGESESGDFNYFMALYPYSAAMGCDGEYIKANLSGQQVAKAGSFAPNTNISLAKNLGLSLSFFNVCSWFRFSVTKEGVKWVIFRGNNDEDVTGKFRVSMGEDNRPTAPEVIEGKKEITLHLPDYEPFEVGKIYYITLFPQVFTKGFTVTFKTDTEIATRSISAKATFLRSKYNSGIGFDSPEKGVVYTEDPNAENLSGGVEGGTESGLYLGITYFDSSLTPYPLSVLEEDTINGFNRFIDARSEMGSKTWLYYAVDKAAERLRQTTFPENLTTVAIVTFTDGQDDGSASPKSAETGKVYGRDDYQNELDEILSTPIHGVNVSSYAIGLCRDKSTMATFENNLKAIAYPHSNYFLKYNMSDIESTFGDIAKELSNTVKIQSLKIRMAPQYNGDTFRFTYDNVTNPSNSKLFIEGTYYYNLTSYRLDNIKYSNGLTCATGSTASGRYIPEDDVVEFVFEGLHLDGNAEMSNKFYKRWLYHEDTGQWTNETAESEKLDGDNGFIRELKSAAIILNLDSTLSLNSDGNDNFSKLKQYSKAFIRTLYNSSIDPEAVRKVTLNKSNMFMEVGEQETLTATIIPSTAIEKTVIWSSVDSSIASIDNSGTIRANSVGTTTITATTRDGGKKASCEVTVIQKATGIALSQVTADCYTGESFVLMATVSPENVTDKQILWTSSAPSVAIVDENGLISALKAGSADITAMTADGSNLSAICHLSVKQHVTNLEIMPINAFVGLTRQIPYSVLPADATDKTVRWESSDPEVASVDGDGKITGYQEGVVNITITAEDSNVSITREIQVIRPVERIEMVNELKLSAGDIHRIDAVVYPSDATCQTLTWHSDNENVVGVSESGLIMAISAGTAIITVSTTDESEVYAQLAVTVTKSVESISLSTESATLEIGKTLSIDAFVKPTDATNQNVLWSSSDENIVIVDGDGLATGVSCGEAMITATTEDGDFQSTCLITVTYSTTPIHLALAIKKKGEEQLYYIKDGSSFDNSVYSMSGICIQTNNQSFILYMSDAMIKVYGYDANGQITKTAYMDGPTNKTNAANYSLPNFSQALWLSQNMTIVNNALKQFGGRQLHTDKQYWALEKIGNIGNVFYYFGENIQPTMETSDEMTCRIREVLAL